MDKILYIGNFLDGTGYSKAAIGNVCAMDYIGLDVVARNISFNNRNEKPNEIIQKCLNKNPINCNIVITHSLPYYFDYNGKFDKNIGIFAWETSKIPESWVKSINCMNEIWVINRQMVHACEHSGIKVPIKICPHAFDENFYTQKFQTNNQKLKEIFENIEDSFVFYTIGEYVNRKNFPALLAAFHAEFGSDEQVNLLIKTSKDGQSPEETLKQIQQTSENIKRGMKLYGNNLSKYKSEHIITGFLSDNDIGYLHQNSNCFVTSSYGEAWSLPAADACFFGKTPIVPKSTGFLDYINRENHHKNGYFIEVMATPVWGVNESFPDLYSGKAEWWEPNISDLRRCLRFVYDDWFNEIPNYKLMQSEGRKTCKDFSYESVGQIIKKNLYD